MIMMYALGEGICSGIMAGIAQGDCHKRPRSSNDQIDLLLLQVRHIIFTACLLSTWHTESTDRSHNAIKAKDVMNHIVYLSITENYNRSRKGAKPKQWLNKLWTLGCKYMIHNSVKRSDSNTRQGVCKYELMSCTVWSYTVLQKC